MIRDYTPYKILVIEDNPGDFMIVEEFITEQILKPTIIPANDFKTAARILANPENHFDVILLDVTLPDKTGKALITEILHLAGHSPVIILTGYSDIDFSIESVSLGILDYLLKDDLSSIALFKSMLHAIERNKIILHLEESEKRYSDLFHLSPLPMWVYDIKTSAILDVNNSAVQHYGYSHDEFLTMAIEEIIVDDKTLVHETSIENTCEVRYAFPRGYIYHRTKNRELILVDTCTNLVMFNGKQANLVLVNDITEKVKYIEAIENQNKQLREIAWIQSHVVRAPLARMMGIINVLQGTEVSSEEQKKLIGYFIESGSELDEIIKDITQKTKNIILTKQ
jgi:PAS domain S-box-containing protein